MNLSATGITVLILILRLILGPRNDPAPSKKDYATSERPDSFLNRVARIALCFTTNDTLRFYPESSDAQRKTMAMELEGNVGLVTGGEYRLGLHSWPGRAFQRMISLGCQCLGLVSTTGM